jgi:hypothetical protein
MVAVPEMCVSAPVAKTDTGRSSVPVHSRRVVAVAVSAMELLRPESDLVRLIEGFPHVDLLVAGEDLPATAPGPVGVLGYTEYADYDDDQDGAGASGDPDVDEVRDGVARLGLPGLHLHRLGLRLPLHPGAEGDLVAALSELVGFDPEPGVYCLAPAPALGDPGRTVNRAAQRIAQVYGIPLLRYRCLELSVVGDGMP